MPNSLSQFFILSPRGDSIIFRDLRRDCPKNTTESFYRNVKFWGGKVAEAPPVFNLDHLNYIYLKKNGLYFVFISRDNVSPNYATELLIRLTKVMKDYCGVTHASHTHTHTIHPTLAHAHSVGPPWRERMERELRRSCGWEHHPPAAAGSVAA